MSKRSITDFFKPFAFPRETKCPPLGEESDELRPSQRSRSNTPQAALRRTTDQVKPSVAPKHAPLVSSQSSALSSLRDLTPSTPEGQPSQAQELSSIRSDENVPTQFLAEDVTASQAPVISSSQRTIRNGEVVIRDSDDERSDTDISLEDLDDIIASRRPPLESSPSSEDELPSLPSLRTTRSKASKHTSKGRPTLPTADANQSRPVLIPKFKFSLEALVKQRQLDEDSRLSIENAKFLLDSLEGQISAASAAGSATLDEDLLATVIKNEDDVDNVDRLMGAIQRTEALDQPKIWRFFHEDNQVINVEPPKCPTVSDPYWKSVFEALRVREISFSAAAGSQIKFQGIGDQITDCLDLSKCNQLFGYAGATSEALDFGQAAIPVAAASDAALTPIYRGVGDLGLQLQLLRHLPATSFRLSLLRRRLALAFFFHDQAYLSIEREQLVDLKAIARHLNKPQFVINGETDYPGLAASIAILAIGLDNGDPPSTDAGKDAETAFNEGVDILAQRIKTIYTQIVDTGASHVKRTEAKEVLESFHSCLVYTVRTKQKPRGMIWGDDTGTEKQKTMMNDFAQRQGVGTI
ncbi:MAG: hypothetical protein Q9225_001516 [Loekoesia sp. 1 TL-2023]